MTFILRFNVSLLKMPTNTGEDNPAAVKSKDFNEIKKKTRARPSVFKEGQVNKLNTTFTKGRIQMV